MTKCRPKFGLLITIIIDLMRVQVLLVPTSFKLFLYDSMASEVRLYFKAFQHQIYGFRDVHEVEAQFITFKFKKKKKYFCLIAFQ